MPSHHLITIQSPHSKCEKDLEVPSNEPIQAYLPDLIKVLRWPEFPPDEHTSYFLSSEHLQALEETKSLADLGIENFEVLTLARKSELGSEKSKDSTSSREPETIDIPLPLPLWQRIPVEKPSLVSLHGVIYELGSPPLQIGRKSGASQPDIDLNEVDIKMRSSRRHAEVIKEGKDYLLHAFATKNGTFINGAELPPGEKRVLKNGDQILFGFRGVELVFRMP